MTIETLHRGHWPTPAALVAAGPVAEAIVMARARAKERQLRAVLSPEARAALEQMDEAMGFPVLLAPHEGTIRALAASEAAGEVSS